MNFNYGYGTQGTGNGYYNGQAGYYGGAMGGY